MKYSKKEVSKVDQLITGFNNLKKHTARKTVPFEAYKARCRLCNKAEETGWHLAFECHFTRKEAKHLRANKIKHNWTAKQMVDFVNTDIIDQMLTERGALTLPQLS